MTRQVKYKETGLEWCPQIPEHWELKKLKYVGAAIIGITYSPEDVVEEGEGKLVLRASNIQNGILAFEDNVFVNIEVNDKYLTKTDDILLCARNGSPHLVGKNALITIDYEGYTFGAFMLVYRSNFGKYAYHIFNSNLFKCQTGLFKTVTINQLTTGTINNMYVPIPPLTEQQKITDYLDQKTTLIDSIIAKKEKQIKLYEEERTAVINHAVTKGLNPNAKMKDSGIEWLGEIPEHWEVKKAKWISNIETGNKNTDDRVIDGEYPFFVRSQDIKYSNDFSYDKEAVLTAGDGAGVGKVFHYYKGKFACHQRVYIFSNFREISGKFFYYYFSSNLINLVNSWNAKTTVDSLRLPILQSMSVTIPSIKEQKSIIVCIDQETQRIETLIEKTSKQIDLLKEYKEALINEVVTGQRIVD